MFCCKCGCELIQNAKFCYKCGNKIDYITEQSKTENFSNPKKYKQKEFSVGSNRIIFKDGMCEYIEVRKNFEKQASNNKVVFMEWYDDNISNFDDFITHPIDKINELVEQQVDLGVNVLMKFGVDYVDRDTIMNEILNGNNIEKNFELYTTGIAEIFKKIDDDLQQRKYRQMLRGSRWSGGGFGIKNAILGSIKADLMNVGSRALGTIPEALNKMVSNAEVDSMKSSIIRGDVYVSLVEGLYNLSCKVFDCVIQYLEAEGKIIHVDMGKIEKNEIAKLHNYMQLLSQGKINKSIALEKISISLNKCPFHLHFYRDMYRIDRTLDRQLSAIAEYTGSLYEYKMWVESIDKA